MHKWNDNYYNGITVMVYNNNPNNNILFHTYYNIILYYVYT